MDHLNHRHILVTASGLRHPPRDPEHVAAWLTKMVSVVDMTILMGPYTIRCDAAANEGCTGVVVITTSHASVHFWDEVADPFVKMDLYSCADFDSNMVLNMLGEFDPQTVEWLVIDRNQTMKIVERGIVGGSWPKTLWFAIRNFFRV
jgi:S-adenosylmethionine/arginine decarboxylase-like enzyme